MARISDCSTKSMVGAVDQEAVNVCADMGSRSDVLFLTWVLHLHLLSSDNADPIATNP